MAKGSSDPPDFEPCGDSHGGMNSKELNHISKPPRRLIMSKRLIAISAAAVVGTASLAFGADTSADRYVERIIPQGGGRYGIVLVPVDRDRARSADEAPYALTGRDEGGRTRYPKAIPSHPRGPRSDW
jgi:hypothetical protein